jgi:hypothetical protein
VRAVGDVAPDGNGAAAKLPDLLRGLLGVDEPLRLRGLGKRPVLLRAFAGLELNVGENDVGARPGQGQRVSPADSARAPSDERDPP